MNKKPKIGIAFGGGGTRAGANIGALEVLEQNNIKIDMVSGTSAGSAAAALCAWGYDSHFIKEIFLNTDLTELIGPKPSMTGLLVPEGYLKIIREHTGDGNIEDAFLPLYIVSADLVSKKQVIFTEGNIARAVHASSAIPGLIKPVKLGDMLLTDGGIINNCPADVLRANGADIVLAINCSCMAPYKPKNHIDVVLRAMDMTGGCDPEKIDADWLINPIEEPLGILDRHAMEKSYIMGKQCAEAHIEELKELISNYHGNQS